MMHLKKVLQMSREQHIFFDTRAWDLVRHSNLLFFGAAELIYV